MENQDYRAQLADYLSTCSFDLLDLPEKQDNVQVYTLRSPHHFSKPLLELSQAFLRELAEVTEVDTLGSVQDLSVLNNSDLHLLIYEGSLLQGAKQNRIVNATLVLPPRSKTVIPASCVEAGRWHYSSPKFSKSPIDASSDIRKSLRQSIHSHQDLKGSQSEVWKEVRMYCVRSSSSSPTSDFEEIHRNRETSAQLFPEGLNVPPTKGILVKKEGEWHLDYVADEEAFAGVLPRLLTGYESWQVKPEQEGEKDLREVLLHSVREGEMFSQPSIGSGTDVRIRSPHHHISALMEEGEIVSFSVTSA